MIYVLWYFCLGLLTVALEIGTMQKIDPDAYKRLCEPLISSGWLVFTLFLFIGSAVWPMLAVELAINVLTYLDNKRKKR